MAVADRRLWWSWLRWPVALGIIAWLVLPNLDGLRELIAAGVVWPWLLGSAALRLTALGLASFRWNLLLVGQEIHLPWRRILRLLCVGYVCNFLLPGTWGGDIARAGLIAADTPSRRMRGAATVPLDRGLGLLAFVLIGAIAGLVRWPQVPVGPPSWAVITLGVLAVGGLVLLCAMLMLPLPRRRRNPGGETITSNDPQLAEAQVRDAIDPSADPPEPALTRRQRLGRELMFGLLSLRASRSSVVVAFLLAIVGHTCLCLSLYCCLLAYPAANVPATATDHLWLVPAAEVPAAFLPVPGGVGAREGTLALLYGALTTDSLLSEHYAGIGVIVAATFSMVCLVLAVLIGLGLALSGLWPTRTVSIEPTSDTESSVEAAN